MNVKYKIKNSFIIRAVIKPYMNHTRNLALKKYSKSNDSAYIRTLKGKYDKKRCFIIGNGPSLTVEDLEKLNTEFTFASNRIYMIFDQTKWRPNFYFAVDSDFIIKSKNDLYTLDGSEMFLCVKDDFNFDAFNCKATRIYEYTKFKINKWNDLTSHISEDVSKYFSVGYTVTFTAIQMAIYMGFKEIYLLGVDFNYSVIRNKKGRIQKNDGTKDYFFDKKYYSTVLNYSSTLHAYNVAKEYAEQHGIKIYNATRGGKLEVFERVDFDSLFNNSTLNEGEN